MQGRSPDVRAVFVRPVVDQCVQDVEGQVHHRAALVVVPFCADKNLSSWRSQNDGAGVVETVLMSLGGHPPISRVVS